MSASAWDRAVEAAFDNLFHREDCSHVDALSEFHPRSRERLRLALAAALPVLLEELAQRIEGGADGLVRTARQAVEEGNKVDFVRDDTLHMAAAFRDGVRL